MVLREGLREYPANRIFGHRNRAVHARRTPRRDFRRRSKPLSRYDSKPWIGFRRAALADGVTEGSARYYARSRAARAKLAAYSGINRSVRGLGLGRSER